MGGMSLLAGLVQGYSKAKEAQAHEELAGRASSREAMMTYLGHMMSNPNVPTEHQQWAMGKLQELAQADVTKKLPKVDLGELPPVQTQAPPQQQVQTMPGAGPQMPPGAIPPPQPPQGLGGGQTGQGGAPGRVGQQPGGQSNALGQVPPSGPVVGTPLQAPPQGLLSIGPPQPPQILSRGGPHLLSPEEHQQQAQNAFQSQMNALQQRFPEKTPTDIAQFMEKGTWPVPVKPNVHTLSPGQQLVEEGSGKVLAKNEEAKPGKSGFSVEKGPSGEPLIKDNSTGATLTDAEVQSRPEAKALYESETKAAAAKEKEQEAKETRQGARQAAQQARAFAQQAKMLEARQETLTANTKAMVEASPKVLELSQKIRQDLKTASTGPFAGRWQEYWAGKVGTGNPEFTRLRTNTALLQTALMKMHVGARGGQQMMDHFKNLIDSGKQAPENMNAALDEIDDYAKQIKTQGVEANERVAAKAEGRAGKPSPPEKPKTSEAPSGGGKEIHYKIVNGQLVAQ